MPLPKPNDGESENDFIERCMSNETMKEDYPDNDQRLAVCYNQWEGDSEQSERRITLQAELRAVDENTKKVGRLEGYAALFDNPTELWDGYYEQIRAGAFARTLREGADVRALFNHNPDMVLGRNKAGTLTLRETKKGLKVNIWPPDTQIGRDVVTSVKRGDISQMSFAFRAIKTTDEEKGKGEWLRTLEDVDLYDISVVTYPAYPDTTVAARSYRRCTEQPSSMSDVAADRDAELVCDAESLRCTARIKELMASQRDLEDRCRK